MPEPQFAGLNLQEVLDFRIQCPWKNELRSARLFWESEIQGFSEVVVSSRLTSERVDGFPASLPPGRMARTVIGTGLYPVGGTWVCSWDGVGDVSVSVDGQSTRSTSNQFSFTRTTTGNASIQVYIHATNPADPVRNLWIGEQQYFTTRNELRLKPQWRDHIIAAGVRHIRFMQWQATGGPVTHWGPGTNGTKSPYAPGEADYFTDSSYVQGLPAQPDIDLGNGACYSSILNAAIELGLASAWLCVPHAADDDIASDELIESEALSFVEQMIRFGASHRHPFLNTRFAGDWWIEFGNETWNPSLGPAYQYCVDRGVALGLDGTNDHEKGHSFYAYRSKHVFASALAAKQAWGLPGNIKRVLAGQATAGEYPFRFRSQIGALQANPENVDADYWSVASYCAHVEYEAGDPTPRIRLGSNNPWHTPAQFVALTDEQLAAEARNDLTLRVLAPATSMAAPWFPSNPIQRDGGIAADIIFAGDRGMDVICYEGGGTHITLPKGGANEAAWAAASTRSSAWHRSLSSAFVTFDILEAHVAAGCKGTFLFDEGTAWGRDGYWSWYEDHRGGYTMHPRYAAASLHHNQGGGGVISAVVQDDATIVSRASAVTPALTQGNVLVSSFSAVASASEVTPSLSTTNHEATVEDWESVASATEVTPFLTLPVLVTVESCTAVASATAVTPNLVQPPIHSADVGHWECLAGASAVTPTLATSTLTATVASAVSYTCATKVTATLLTLQLEAVVADSTTQTRAAAATPLLTGAVGTLTHNQNMPIDLRVEPQFLDAFVPHGTTIYRGQILAWYQGRVRPWRNGDDFAGVSTVDEDGTEVGPDGVLGLRAYDYSVRFLSAGAVWITLDTNAVIGDAVYVASDAAFTLKPNGTEQVGKVILVRRGGRRALLHFEGFDP